MERAVTIKDIAQKAGVHYSTVSLALRDSPRLPLATRQKIKRVADSLGYVPNAALKALCAYRNAQLAHPIRSALAYLTDSSMDYPFGAMVYRHAKAQAARLGYNLIYYNLHEEGITLDRLRSIWWNSGIKGVLIGPFMEAMTELDDKWDKWVVVAYGYSVESPQFNRAVLDHYHNMLHHLEALYGLGYRRIGLNMAQGLNERTHEMLHGAYLIHQQRHGLDAIPVNRREGDKPEAIREWIERERLDLVIAYEGVYEGMLESGLRVPEDVGFSLLSTPNYMEPETAIWAGFESRPDMLASGAVSLLVSLIHENAYGLPEVPRTIMIPGVFRRGSTVR